MVHTHTQNQRRPRKMSPSAHNATNLLTTFPDEIMLTSLAKLDTQDVLNFRLCCKAFVDVCSSVIRSRLKILYLHPLTTTAKRFQHICTSDLLDEIEEIALVGKMLWRTIDSHVGRIRYNGLLLDGRFCTWVRDFDSAALAKILRRLPKLRRIRYTEACAEPGFNKISQDRIDGHADKCAADLYTLGPNPFSPPDRTICEFDIIFSLLRSEHLHITELAIAKDLPSFASTRLPWLRDSEGPIPDTDLRWPHHTITEIDPRWPHLTKLDLAITNDQTGDLWSRDCHGMIRSSASTLKHLRIVMHFGASVGGHKADKSLVNVLTAAQAAHHDLGWVEYTPMRFEKLETFQLVTLYPDPIASRRSKHDRGQTYRPGVQSFDLTSFLTTHKSTLKQVEIENVLFDSSKLTGAWIADAMQDTLYATSKRQAILPSCHFRWVFNGKYGQDVRCARSAGCDDSYDCKYGCGIVFQDANNASKRMLPVALNTLARNFGAEWDEVKKVWIFDFEAKEIRFIDWERGKGLASMQGDLLQSLESTDK